MEDYKKPQMEIMVFEETIITTSDSDIITPGLPINP